MRLGIYAPLTRSEPTALAVRLASALRRHGLVTSTTWLAPRISRPVCAEWDYRARLRRGGSGNGYSALSHRRGGGGTVGGGTVGGGISGGGTINGGGTVGGDRGGGTINGGGSTASLPAWAAACDLRVWCGAEADQAVLRVAKAARHDAIDVLVPLLHIADAAAANAICRYDAVLCPDLQTAATLMHLPGVAESGTRVRYVPWHSGVARQLPADAGDTDSSSALLYVDSRTAAAGCVLDAAEGILRQAPPALKRLTLVVDAAPARSWRRRLDQLRAADSRLDCKLRVPLDALPVLMRDHDWFIDTATQTCAGLRVLQALDLGRAVIAWDVRPFRGLKGCRTARCRRTLSALGAESAVWDTKALTACCAPLLGCRSACAEVRREAQSRAAWGDQDFRLLLASALEGC